MHQCGHMTQVRTLVLRECEISDAGAEAQMRYGHARCKLDGKCSRLLCKALGAALAVNQGIEDLDLQHPASMFGRS